MLVGEGVPAVPTGQMQDMCSPGDQWESTEKSFLKNNGTEVTGEDIQQRHGWTSLVEGFSDRGSAVPGSLPTASQDTTLLLWLPSVSQSLRRRLKKKKKKNPIWGW